jgi:hypothetical protein
LRTSPCEPAHEVEGEYPLRHWLSGHHLYRLAPTGEVVEGDVPDDFDDELWCESGGGVGQLGRESQPQLPGVLDVLGQFGLGGYGPSSSTPEPAAREMTSPPRPRSTYAKPTAMSMPATGPTTYTQ